jgi:hydrogenase maturation protein HypF
LAIGVRGVVQGVGFRPFVYNTARSLGLSGWVLNEADVVRIEVQGAAAALDGFLDALRHGPPPQARIDAMDVAEIATQECPEEEGSGGFQIRTSTGQSAPRPTIPADLATCGDCLAEINDPAQRRYRYPFTNCTNCGPRWSIIRLLPYDRPRTSMAAFVMCPECQAEYDDPSDRRFHAQPIACPRCGPAVQLLDNLGRSIAREDAALIAAVEALLAGRIVALKGLGGFQLLADATHASAVALLRRRKRRPDRPFAVMLPSLDDARKYCHVSDEEALALTSHRAPIVLLRSRAGQGGGHSCLPQVDKNVCPTGPLDSRLSTLDSQLLNGVAPGNPYLGVMLPYTPLHHLLMQAVGRPIVCTSGNLSEEPMAIATDDALRRLGPIADVFLIHNRPIVRPVDDSIVRLGPDGVQVLRRARGFAPLPLEITIDGQGRAGGPTILAVGGHLKNTAALCLSRVRVYTHADELADESGRVRVYTHADQRADEPIRVRASTHPTGDASTPPAQVVMSAHVGDLDSVLSIEVFRRAIDDLLDFFQARPDAVACDLHPDYASTRQAEVLPARRDVPLLRVQHHHAHVAACMAEHGLTGPVLGFAWDGTGYGTDGTVWGGEMLLCQRGVFRRAAHLRTFALPGGDRAVREPRRSALGLLYELFGPEAAAHASAWFTAAETNTVLAALARGLNAPRTSSMGRLFDAVAAICGLPPVISFEGQAAMALEFAADEDEQESYEFALSGGECIVVDWAPMIRAVLADRAGGVPVGRISARFHNALAETAVAVARCVGCPTVALTGGCFQNDLLVRRVRQRLSAAGFQVYTHLKVPPGDGGIALGQVYVALLKTISGWHG